MTLQDHGIVVLPQPMPADLVKALSEEGYYATNQAYARNHPTENGWRVNVTPARITRAHAWNYLWAAKDAMDMVKAHATAYLGAGWGINQLIWDHTGVTRDPLFTHHVDDFHGKKALKVYVYLTDASQVNGALEYAVGSHRTGKAENRPLWFGGSAGTVILFDPAGVHGSGPVRHGSRYIFRAHFVEAAYVRRYLPDQLPWYQRPLARVLAKVSP